MEEEEIAECLLIPSFYELIQALEGEEGPRRDYRILLRGPSLDLQEASAELQAFTQGLHPNYPDFRVEARHVEAHSPQFNPILIPI